MKLVTLLIALINTSNLDFAQHENHQPKTDTSKTAVKPKSPKMTAMSMIGTNHVHVDYEVLEKGKTKEQLK